MESRRKRAEELFREGYNCSQSVFAAYADLLGIETEMALKLSASFGAGMGRMREVCGTASAMFLVAGLLTGATDGRDAVGKKHNYDVVQSIAAEFKERNGSLYCRDLLGLGKDGKPVDTKNTMPEERTEEYYKKRPCLRLIDEAAEQIERMFFRG